MPIEHAPAPRTFRREGLRDASWLALLLVAACSQGPPPAPVPAHRLDIPDGRVEFSMRQRASRPLPGSDGTVLLTLGDITRGQVTVSLARDDGAPVLAPLSLRQGDAARFVLGDARYVLVARKLRNVLIGADTAVFALSPDDAPAPLSETEKIERLIDAVESLSDAVFVRNGAVYPASEAAQHLRSKWAWQSSEIDTARKFIDLAATRSSTSGEAYVLRFGDGREIPSAEFLDAELARMDRAR